MGTGSTVGLPVE
jgi:hypothetical protein